LSSSKSRDESFIFRFEKPGKFITIPNVPRTEFLAVKELLEKTLQRRIETNAEVFIILSRFFQFWYNNISTQDAYELRSIVERLVTIKRMDRKVYDGVREKLKAWLDGFIRDLEEISVGVSEMFGTNIWISREDLEEELSGEEETLENPERTDEKLRKEARK